MDEFLKKQIGIVLEEGRFIENVLEKSFGIQKAGIGMPKMPAIPGATPKKTSVPGGGRSHSYVKKEENFFGPGKHRYWYKMPDGSMKASDQAESPKGGKATPEAEKQPKTLSPQEKKNYGTTIEKLRSEVTKKLGGQPEGPKATEDEKLKQVFQEKKPGESDIAHDARLLNSAMDYLIDLQNRIEKMPATNETAVQLKKQITDVQMAKLKNQLQSQISGFGEKSPITKPTQKVGSTTVGKEKPNYQQMKQKMNEYEQRGLKNLSGDERAEYFKNKKDIQKIETEEAELTQTKSSIADKQIREQKSMQYVNNFDQEVPPANKIAIPNVEPLYADIEKAENNGKVNPNSPKNDTMIKMQSARFLNRAFKQLKMDKASIVAISGKGSAISLAIKAPIKINSNQLRQLNKLIQRQYGLTSPAQVAYKANNVVEFEFSKQKKEDIIKPKFSNSVKDLHNYIESNKTPNGLRRLAMVIGYDAKGQPIMADFSNYEATSIATVSSPGKGKTFNTESSLLSMISNYSPDEVKFDLIDAQGVGFASIREKSSNYLDNPPGMGVQTKEDVQRVMGILESNMQAITDRGAVLSKYGVQKMTDLPEKAGNRQFPLKMVVIDEYQGLFEGIDKVYGEGSAESKQMQTKLKNYMSSIQKQGRKVGVIPWVMTQTVDDNNAEYLRNASTKMLYQVEDPKTGYDFLGVKGRDVARNLIDVGQSAIQVSGKRHYGVGVTRNSEVTEAVTSEAGRR